jgi:hypothetical protein
MSHPYRRRDKAGDRRAFEPVSGALALFVWQAGQPRGGHCFLPRYVLAAFLVALAFAQQSTDPPGTIDGAVLLHGLLSQWSN